MRQQIAAECIGLGDGGREADAASGGGQTRQPRETERQEIAALRIGQCVQFVEDESSRIARNKIETYLAGALNSERHTHTM